MRIRIITSLLVLALLSCENEPEDTSHEVETEVQDKVDEHGVIEEERQAPVEMFIEDFPKKWIGLTEEGEDLVIYNYCEAETQFFELTAEKGDSWNIYLAYGQDGDICEIENFSAMQEEQELMQVVNGSFEYRISPQEGLRLVSFSWNKDEKYGHFSGIGLMSEYFVPAEDASHYEMIDEDCEGLWQ
jgi:hypothetical protein